MPTCDFGVLMALTTVLSTECQAVLSAAVSGTSDTTELSCDECMCYMELTPEEFLEATGVSSASCGAGSGNSFLDERNMCEQFMDSACQETTGITSFTKQAFPNTYQSLHL